MNLNALRPVELIAATLVSAVVLLVAIAPSLVAAPAGATAPAVPGAADAGIECPLSPEARLA
ncbi:MAG TPA: hypothetical protein VMU00_00710 [Steroidobacteraceae bacterium]|nr:hypothetical protein [Steroidobacteraceae bacterium]